ncbi:MAG: hypothetical protein QOF70_2432 [Acetobacteraceae bacterium]|jgi:hypothetical protein|nr:hypothetical protein [Rhodopila sp.]MEA2727957.1 hypothetical protein [Acetobacteraceae bacterium]
MRVGWSRGARSIRYQRPVRDRADTSGPSAIVEGTASDRLYWQRPGKLADQALT